MVVVAAALKLVANKARRVLLGELERPAFLEARAFLEACPAMMLMSRGLPGGQAQSAAIMAQSATKSCPVDACRTWVDSMVIGLSLCPWAKPVRDSGGLRYSVTQAREAEGLSAALLHEICLLQSDPEIETTILVHPHIFADDFLAFTEYTQNTEAWMQDEGLVEDFQLVGFHPAHQFMNEEQDDAGNFANRSPYPMIHLLRQESEP